MLQSQADKLKELQKQFEIALTATKREEEQKSQVNIYWNCHQKL